MNEWWYMNSTGTDESPSIFYLHLASLTFLLRRTLVFFPHFCTWSSVQWSFLSCLCSTFACCRSYIPGIFASTPGSCTYVHLLYTFYLFTFSFVHLQWTVLRSRFFFGRYSGDFTIFYFSFPVHLLLSSDPEYTTSFCTWKDLLSFVHVGQSALMVHVNVYVHWSVVHDREWVQAGAWTSFCIERRCSSMNFLSTFLYIFVQSSQIFSCRTWAWAYRSDLSFLFLFLYFAFHSRRTTPPHLKGGPWAGMSVVMKYRRRRRGGRWWYMDLIFSSFVHFCTRWRWWRWWRHLCMYRSSNLLYSVVHLLYMKKTFCTSFLSHSARWSSIRSCTDLVHIIFLYIFLYCARARAPHARASFCPFCCCCLLLYIVPAVHVIGKW